MTRIEPGNRAVANNTQIDLAHVPGQDSNLGLQNEDTPLTTKPKDPLTK